MQVTKSNDGDTIVSFTIFTSALTRITRELGITIGLKLEEIREMLRKLHHVILLNKKMLVAVIFSWKGKLRRHIESIFLLFPPWLPFSEDLFYYVMRVSISDSI